MGGVRAEELRVDRLELQAEILKALPENAIGRLRLFERIGPRVNERANGLVAVEKGNRDLEFVRRRFAFDAGDSHPVLARLCELNRREVGDTIGRDVLVRIAHFVYELLRDRGNVDPAARGGMLDEIERAIGSRFDDGITDVGHVRDALPVLEAVAAAALRAAFDDVSRDRPRCNTIPCVRRPPKGVHQRSQREPGVSHAPRDDDLGAALQRLHHRRGAEVGVRGKDAVAHVAQGTAGVEVLERVAAGEQPVQTTQEIVAGDHADRQFPPQPEPPRDVGDRHGAGTRVHTAGVRRDLYPALHGGR